MDRERTHSTAPDTSQSLKSHHHRHKRRKHDRHHRRHHRHSRHSQSQDDVIITQPAQPPREPVSVRAFHSYPHQQYNVGEFKFTLYSCLQPTGEILGYGAFAVVIRVRDTRWDVQGRLLAVKKNINAFQTVADGRKLLRELMILKHFTDHPHDSVMSLHGVVVPPNEQRETFDSLYLIMSQHQSNLARVIERNMPLTPRHISFIFFQILSAVRALHAAGIIHRDLKPDNVLINSECNVKVIDFNMSREIPDEDDGVLLSDVVVARWYRAPEICLTQGGYTEKIDEWSVGCIMAEVYLKEPLFRTASNSLELVKLSMQLLGTPRGDLSWITRSDEFDFREYVEGTSYEPQDLSMVFPKASPVEVEVLSRLLTIAPQSRASADEAMKLPLFVGQSVRRKDNTPFQMPPYVRAVMFGDDVSEAELRSVMYDVLCNFNRAVLGDKDTSDVKQVSRSDRREPLSQSRRPSSERRPTTP